MVQAPTAPFSQDYKKLLQIVNGPIQIANPTFASVSVSQHLKCSICYEVFFKPRRLYCGHTFCKSCLQEIIKGNTVGGSQNAGDAVCPLCRQIIDKQKIGDDLIALGVISQLQVLCPNQQCTWKGPNFELPQHYKIKCIFRNKQESIPWFQLFPDFVPKEGQKQQQPKSLLQKGSLLSRIYAQSPQIQKRSSFKQFKNNFTPDKSSQNNQIRRDKLRQENQKKELEQKLKRRQKDINNIMTGQIDEETRAKIRKQQQDKKRQKQLKRQKNKEQLKMLLNGQTEQQKQKEVFKERQSAKNQMIRSNQNQKMDYLKRIFKKKQNQDEGRSSYNVQQINKLNSMPDLVIPKQVPLSKVILPQQQPDGQPSYMVKNRIYQASYQKHRLVRKPYVQPQNYGQMPKGIPHRIYTNPSQFSDLQYLKREDERLVNMAQLQQQSNVNSLHNKKKYVGTANYKWLIKPIKKLNKQPFSYFNISKQRNKEIINQRVRVELILELTKYLLIKFYKVFIFRYLIKKMLANGQLFLNCHIFNIPSFRYCIVSKYLTQTQTLQKVLIINLIRINSTLRINKCQEKYKINIACFSFCFCFQHQSSFLIARFKKYLRNS